MLYKTILTSVMTKALDRLSDEELRPLLNRIFKGEDTALSDNAELYYELLNEFIAEKETKSEKKKGNLRQYKNKNKENNEGYKIDITDD